MHTSLRLRRTVVMCRRFQRASPLAQHFSTQASSVPGGDSTSSGSSSAQGATAVDEDDDEFEARARSRSTSRFSRERPYYERASEEVHPTIDEIVRVDHAGEYGAVRIYEGQLAILGKTKEAPLLKHMKEQEEEHLTACTDMLLKQRGRPTLLLPLWDAAGYVLGAGSALLGKEAAMACTVAVEDAVSEHYNDQLRTLHEPQFEKYTELRQLIKKNRDEELEHLQHGLDNDAELAPMYQAFSSVIKYGCKAAIWTAKYV